MKSTVKVSLFLALWILPAIALAADLVNINTADSTTLQTLNGIGPSKAQAIIDYRTQNGPFQTIEDIQNVSGIGPATYANIKDSITVGDAPQQPQAQQAAQGAGDASTTQSTDEPSPATAAGGAAVAGLVAKAEAPAAAVVGEGESFSGQAFTQDGVAVDNARYLWSFGDGATAEGQNVLHTYGYPGTYEAVLSVASGYSSGETEVSLKVVAANLALVLENDDSLTVVNNTAQELDLGLWLLACGGKTFLIPARTFVLAGAGVRFSPNITGLTCDLSAQLRYPQGTAAAQASLSDDSPLHGQAVPASDVHPAVAAQPTVSVARNSAAATTTQTAAAAYSGQSPLVTWGASGLGIVLMGVAGAMWLEPQFLYRRKTATAVSAEEFEVE